MESEAGNNQGYRANYIYDGGGAALADELEMRVASPLPHKKARIEIIPLIDIMFFLLASFMMVSLSQVHMKGIRVNLPSSLAVPQPTPPTNKKDYTSLFVDGDGLVHFDQEVVTDGDVMPRLMQLYKANHKRKFSSAPTKKRCTAMSLSCSIVSVHPGLKKSATRSKSRRCAPGPERLVLPAARRHHLLRPATCAVVWPMPAR